MLIDMHNIILQFGSFNSGSTFVGGLLYSNCKDKNSSGLIKVYFVC